MTAVEFECLVLWYREEQTTEQIEIILKIPQAEHNKERAKILKIACPEVAVQESRIYHIARLNMV